MVDLYLQAMMHGEIPSRQNIKTATDPAKDKLDLITEKYIKGYINSLNLEVEYAQNQFISPEMKKAEIKQQMLAELKLNDQTAYLSEAFNFLNANGKKYLDDEQYQQMLNEFDLIDALIDQLQQNEEIPENLHDFFQFNQQIAEEIQKIAILKYKEEEFSICTSLFVLLSILNPESIEYWYRQGIAWQKCEKYDLALKAYNEALKLNPELLAIRLFLVDCYLQKEMPDMAKSEFMLAKQMIEETEVDEIWLSFIQDLKEMTGW